MSLWKRNVAPEWAKHSVIGKAGYYHPVTNEVLVPFVSKAWGGTSSVDTYNANPAIVATPSVQQVTFYKGFIAASGEAILDRKTSFNTGNTLKFAVRFNGQVVVTTTGGTPYLEVVINGNTRHAPYLETGWGNNTATLMFEYQLVAADTAAVGQVTLGVIQLNSGTIKSLYAPYNSATLTLPTVLILNANTITVKFNVDDVVTQAHGAGNVAVKQVTSYDTFITIIGTAGTFGSGGITDSVTGATATVTGTSGQTGAVVVVSPSPTYLSSVVVANATHFTSAGVLAMTAGFSKPVNYTPGTSGTSGIAVAFTVGGGVASAGTAGVATGLVNNIVFKYTIKGNTIDSSGTGGVSIVSPILVGVGGSLVDANGNVPQETFTPPATNSDYVN